MTQITISNLTLIITLIVGVFGLFGTIFGIYLYFRNPQIKTDQVTLKLSDDVKDLQKQLTEVKETHLKSVETDIKTLTTAVNDLSRTVIKLSTIIDERIPKGNK